jgi:putative SOS response-associated peptidase YedK
VDAVCGRYAASRNPDDLVEEFEVVEKPEQTLRPSWNVAPTQDVYAVLERPPRDDKEAPALRRLQVARWGLVPSWAKDPSIGNRMINARMETVHEKPAFKRAFAGRRALLPADGYFEWYGEKGKKQPFFIKPADGGVLAMAGLYELWKDRSVPENSDQDPWLWTVTVLTTTATDDVGRIHDRMPLLVEPQRYAEWLDPGVGDPDRLRRLLVPAAPGLLTAFPVSKDVNNVRNNRPELVEPLPIEGLPEGVSVDDALDAVDAGATDDEPKLF